MQVHNGRGESFRCAKSLETSGQCRVGIVASDMGDTDLRSVGRKYFFCVFPLCELLDTSETGLHYGRLNQREARAIGPEMTSGAINKST